MYGAMESDRGILGRVSFSVPRPKLTVIPVCTFNKYGILAMIKYTQGIMAML